MKPPLGPDGKPIGPKMLAPIFSINLIEQEVSTQRWIDIPEEILGILAKCRPTPGSLGIVISEAIEAAVVC